MTSFGARIGRPDQKPRLTFGKNLVQIPFELHNGEFLRMTTDLWTTPNGASVAETGVVPDVLVDLGPHLTVAEVVDAAISAAGLIGDLWNGA